MCQIFFQGFYLHYFLEFFHLYYDTDTVITPFCGWRKWNMERLSTFFEITRPVNRGVRIQSKAVWLQSSVFCLPLRSSVSWQVKDRGKKCVWLQWHEGLSWPYHRLFEWKDRARLTTTLRWIVELRGEGEGKKWMLHLDTARRAAVQNHGSEKCSSVCVCVCVCVRVCISFIF